MQTQAIFSAFLSNSTMSSGPGWHWLTAGQWEHRSDIWSSLSVGQTIAQANWLNYSCNRLWAGSLAALTITYAFGSAFGGSLGAIPDLANDYGSDHIFYYSCVCNSLLFYQDCLSFFYEKTQSRYIQRREKVRWSLGEWRVPENLIQ